MAHSRQGDHKNSHGKASNHDKPIAFADPGLLQAQQARDKLLSSPYLSLKGPGLIVVKPESPPAQTKNTPAAFADPGLLHAQQAQQDLQSQQAMERLFNSPYLTIHTPSAPAWNEGVRGDPAQQARERLLSSPYLTIKTPSTPIRNTSIRPTPFTFTDPAPAPGPPPQPDSGHTNPQQYLGFADPGLLAVQQAQAKQDEQARLDEQARDQLMTKAYMSIFGPTAHMMNKQSGKPADGTPAAHSSAISGWTEWDVPETDRKRWKNTHDPDYYTSEYDSMDLTPSDTSKKNPYGIDIDNFLHWVYSQVGYHEKGEEKNLNVIGDAGGHTNWTKYGDWYGINGDFVDDDGVEHLAPWCAMFAAWSAQKAGISKDVIPRFSSTNDYIKWYSDPSRNRFMPKGTYKPKAGDMILYRWKEKGVWKGHTGIVVAYSTETEKDGKEKEFVYTIEGNLQDKVYFKKAPLDQWNLKGFGVNGGSSNGIVPDHYITKDGKMN